MSENGLTRRSFLKTGASVTVAGASGFLQGSHVAAQAPKSPRHAFYLALGDTLIPSSPQDPGFATFEPHGIIEELEEQLAGISDEQIEGFNRGSAGAFGNAFVQLNPSDRATYLRTVLSGDQKLGDAATVRNLQSFLRLMRTRIMTLFYQNFPEHHVKRDAQGNPVRDPQERGLVFNPNTEKLKTAWDTTGFGGPLTAKQEEERRKVFGPLWKEYERKMHPSSS